MKPGCDKHTLCDPSTNIYVTAAFTRHFKRKLHHRCKEMQLNMLESFMLTVQNDHSVMIYTTHVLCEHRRRCFRSALVTVHAAREIL